MTIHVSPMTDNIPEGIFEDATGWHVDDEGRLHVTKSGGGNVATYHPGAWASVGRVPETAPASKTTAVATLNGKGPSNAGQTQLSFNADYNDERNKAWAKYTPGLSVIMHVTDEVAETFEQGGRYLITFERAE